MQRWSRDSVLEVYRDVDQQRLAEGNLLPLTSPEIRQLSAGSPDIPGMTTIEQHVGSLSDLHHTLGRVTTKYVMGWSDDQWQEHAHWMRDVWEEKGVDIVGQHEVGVLSRVKLAPHYHLIRRKWGTIANYRVENGIEPRPTYQAAKEWEQPDFITNGREYADFLGRDFGFPLMPTTDDIRAGSAEDRTPIVNQILKNFDSVEAYQATLGFVNGYVLDRWNDEQWRQNYRWLVTVCTTNGIPVSSLNKILEIAGRLHVGPSPEVAQRRFGSVLKYGKFVGHETYQYKRVMSNEGAMRAAMDLAAKQGGPLDFDDLNSQQALTLDMARQRFGGLHNVNLRLGYITGSRGWDKNMMLWWGVTRLMSGFPRIPSYADIEAWSSKHRAPSEHKISIEFGSTRNFRLELDNALDWKERQIRILERRGLARQLSKLALQNNPAIFTPDRSIDNEAFQIFFDLQRAGVSMSLLTRMMNQGIPFEAPRGPLMALTENLYEANMLRTASLRRLEPYIRGLAPLEAEDSWSSFVSDYREQRAA